MTGDAEDPGSSIVARRGQFLQSPPDDKQCLGDYVLGVVAVDPSLDEVQQVRVDGLVQRDVNILANPCSGIHNPYLSATLASVS